MYLIKSAKIKQICSSLNKIKMTKKSKLQKQNQNQNQIYNGNNYFF